MAPDRVSMPETHVGTAADLRQGCIYRFVGSREMGLEVLIPPCLVWMDLDRLRDHMIPRYLQSPG
jgi:hypothetical protein